MKVRKNVFIVVSILLLGHLPNRYAAQAAVILMSIPFLISFVKSYRMDKTSALSNIGSDYLKVILLMCLSFIFSVLGFVLNFTSFNNLFWAAFNFLPILLVGLVFIKVDKDSLLSASVWFMGVQLLFLTFQYLKLAVSSGKLNIFNGNQSAGDHMVGTLGAFSTPLAVVFCILTLVYMKEYVETRSRKYVIYAVLAFIAAILPGAMSVLFVFFFALFCSVIFMQLRSNNKSGRFKVVLALMAFLSIGALTQSNNIDYGYRMLDKIGNHGLPFKAYLYERTFTAGIGTGDIPFYGVGAGNFSSRAAMIVSGEYLLNQPWFIPVTPSTQTEQYITNIYSKINYGEDVMGFDGGSMVSEPFSQYLSVLAENGILGLLALIAVLYILFRKSVVSSDIYMLTFVCFVAVLLFTNAWLEYVEFSVIFYFGLAYFMNTNKEEA